MTSARPQPQYARFYEAGDHVMLRCACCGVKHRGDGLIKTWVISSADSPRVARDFLLLRGY